MLHDSKGIILRTVKYGETSLICTIFTELLGVQSYMVKGVRTAKSRNNKAAALFAGSVLQMVVQQLPNKNLQYIKEYEPAFIYAYLQESPVKNSVAVFAIELVAQLLQADDPQPEMYSFLEQFLRRLDTEAHSVANFPLYFLIQAARLSGYYLAGAYGAATPFVDLREGRFASSQGSLPPFVETPVAAAMSQLNGANCIEAAQQVQLGSALRKEVLQQFIAFLQLHVPHFRPLRSLPVLQAIFG
ncbi:MAG: DNA repair protein RecO [Edaphocola sp.]